MFVKNVFLSLTGSRNLSQIGDSAVESHGEDVDVGKEQFSFLLVPNLIIVQSEVGGSFCHEMEKSLSTADFLKTEIRILKVK